MRRDPKWTGFYVEHDAADYASDTVGPSRTRQEFAEECDINTIMARYDATGVISHVDQREPVYMDFTEIPDDLQGVLAQLSAGTEAFMTLPAAVRKEFDNDPHQFLQFAANPEHLERMREWGLAEPEKAPDAPMRVEVVNPPAERPPDGASP